MKWLVGFGDFSFLCRHSLRGALVYVCYHVGGSKCKIKTKQELRCPLLGGIACCIATGIL